MKVIQIPKSVNLIAFDPGETTGVIKIVNGKLYRAGSLSLWDMLEYTSRKRDWHNPEGVFEHWVAEGFRIYDWNQPKTQALMAPVQVLSYLELYLHRTPRCLHTQYAGEAKPFATDERLQAQGWWGMLQNDHEKDAARHALYYITNNLL